MFIKNRILCLLASAMLATACGGGSSSTANTGSNGTTPGATLPSDNLVVTPNDQQLQGYLALYANQMPYIKGDRSLYNAVNLADFESNQGMFDFAPDGRNYDSPPEIPPRAFAPAAPMAGFGFRVNRYVQADNTGQNVGNQTVVGRVAFNFAERIDSRGIRSNETPESMRFVIDGVEVTNDAQGLLTTVRVRDDARMHVEGRNAAGGEVRASFPVPNDAVRLMSVLNVLDNYEEQYPEPASVVLWFDLETAFSQAGDRLASLEPMRGHFNFNVTMSVARLIRPAAPANDFDPELERRDLIGQPITVNNQPTVTGGGVSGNAWVRMQPWETE